MKLKILFPICLIAISVIAQPSTNETTNRNTAGATNASLDHLPLDTGTNWLIKWEGRCETNDADWKPAVVVGDKLYEMGFPVSNSYCYTRSHSNGIPIVHTNLDSTSNIWITMGTNLPIRIRDIISKTNAAGQVTRELKP
jgi:hypothetical protein